MIIAENDIRLSNFLAQEVLKDLDYHDVYKHAERDLTRTFLRHHNVETLVEEYGEKYDYVFLQHNIDPLQSK